MTARIDYATLLDERTKRLILGGVLLGLFLTALDQTIVAAALPSILADLKGVGLLAWLSTAYLLASTTTVPIYGKLSDLYGRKIVFLTGIVIFLIGSVLCGSAANILTLAIYRGVQGLGAGALTALAFTIPADLYVPAERAKLQGIFTSVFALSSILGPFLGGVLTDTVGWRWIFYVNLPFGAIALAFIIAFMPRLESGLKGRIDYAGAILLFLTVSPFLTALTLDKSLYPWTSPTVLGLLVAASVGLVALLRVESRAEGPVIPLPLFRLPIVSIIIAISTLLGSVFLTVVLFISIFLVNVLGTTATEAGTTLIPLTLGLMASSIAGGTFVQKTGRYKLAAIAGLALVALGMVMLANLGVQSSLTDVRIRLGILGMGFGATFPQMSLALQNAVPYKDVGTVTASRQFFQQLGQTVGAAVFGSILTVLLTTTIASSLKPITAGLPPAAVRVLDPEKLRNGHSEAMAEVAALKAQFSGTLPRQLEAQVDAAIKNAFALSVPRIYSYAAILPFVALLLAFAIPELPLRRSNQDPVPEPSRTADPA